MQPHNRMGPDLPRIVNQQIIRLLPRLLANLRPSVVNVVVTGKAIANSLADYGTPGMATILALPGVTTHSPSESTRPPKHPPTLLPFPAYNAPSNASFGTTP